ncbi:MAG: cold-shock protein [Acidimicrobiales bacterium]
MIGAPRPSASPVRGVVTEFDDDKGFGTVRSDDGRAFFFHCTAVADGTRSIDPDTRVSFEVVAGHLGRWEATRLLKRRQ